MNYKSNSKAWAVPLLLLVTTLMVGCGKNYTENVSQKRKLVPADQEPPFENKVSIKVEGDYRIITSNNVPKHKIGKFPNEGNPNAMSEQRVNLKLPANPKANKQSVPAQKAVGVLLNGVFVESGTGERWTGDGSGPAWMYEALGGALPFGLDENYAHVQPGGKYHYHGQPTGLLKRYEVSPDKHSPLLGWAFDGFPIYVVYGYSDPMDPESDVAEMTSSFRLKKGDRPPTPGGPGGTYDGSFVQDYEYVEGLGTLDECNGRFTITPDFPEGTYAYFLTKKWPIILRNYRGTPMGGPPRPPRKEGGNHPRGGPEHIDYPPYKRPDGSKKVSEEKEAE